MFRKLTATLAAAAVALTGITATPAFAIGEREEDILKLMLGAGAIALLVDRANDKKRQADHNRYRHDYRHDARGRIIPGECVFDVRTRDGRRNVVGKRCVEQSGFRGRLPQDCAFQIRTNRGPTTVYGQRCLRDRGYRIEAARY